MDSSDSIYNIAIEIEYDGARFHGFQKQGNVRTVQLEVEEALSAIAAEPIRITVAGRTDAGVHATQQVVSFRTVACRTESAWVSGTNSKLPDDIVVHAAQKVDDEFNARFSARWRRYFYVFGHAHATPAIGRSAATWLPEQLDEIRMRTAAQAFVGEHDFSSFRAAQCNANTPFRCIHAFDVVRIANFVVLDVIANAYLLRMMRNFAGALLLVSRGRLSQDEIVDILDACDRTLAPPTAGPAGLYMVQIAYPQLDSLLQLRTPPILGPSACESFQQHASHSFPSISTLRARSLGYY